MICLSHFTLTARALSDAGDLEALKALIDEAIENKRAGYGPPTSDINTAIELEQKLKKGRAA